MKKFLNVFFIARVVVIILLLLAMMNHPYNYYIFLKWIVTAVSIYSLYKLIKAKQFILAGFFIAVAVLYNPFMAIHLDHIKWRFLDITSALMFLASIIKVKK